MSVHRRRTVQIACREYEHHPVGAEHRPPLVVFPAFDGRQRRPEARQARREPLAARHEAALAVRLVEEASQRGRQLPCGIGFALLVHEEAVIVGVAAITRQEKATGVVPESQPFRVSGQVPFRRL